MLRALADAPNVAMTLALVSELIHTERTCAGHTVIRAGSGKWQMRRPCAPGVCAELPNALDLFHNAPAAARRNAVRYALSDALCRPPEPGTEVSSSPCFHQSQGATLSSRLLGDLPGPKKSRTVAVPKVVVSASQLPPPGLSRHACEPKWPPLPPCEEAAQLGSY